MNYDKMVNKKGSDLTMNELKILSVLMSEEMYGLQIVETIREYGTTIFLGSIYNILSRLERRGFVESYYGEETSDRGGNRRKYFKITGKGETAVRQAQEAFKELWNWRLAYTGKFIDGAKRPL